MTDDVPRLRPGATPAKPWGIRPYVVGGEVFPTLQALSEPQSKAQFALPDERRAGSSHGSTTRLSNVRSPRVVSFQPNPSA